ncbi:MAG: S-adenosyl-l-methionine hydroxide adenosyltransferase family protein [Salinivenus sp.]
MDPNASLITITTDFGTEDAYVPSMKGTMLSICPGARMVDVTHEISPQDVMEAAFVLRCTVPYFPDGTVHLVVVDPGVGTDRRAVALRHNNQWFVGADNGLFPLVLDEDSPEAAVELDDPDRWRTPTPSTTFHGRDIFAPAAAHLANGDPVDTLGTPIDTLESLHWARPSVDDGTVQGWVVHVDHFGNCVTNIRHSHLARTIGQDADAPIADALRSVQGYAGSRIVRQFGSTYGTVPEGEPLLLIGSTGFLEIAVNGGSAADLLDIRKGDSVKLTLEDAS